MQGANMSIVGCEVLKCLATRITSKCALGDVFFVCLEVTIESRFV